MAGAMALFSSIESALAPDDLLGRQWLATEKANYLTEIAEREPGWYAKPWTISGSIICFVILFSGGSLGICKCRKMRGGNVDRREGGDEERRGEMVADRQQLRMVERDTVTSESEKIRFGDIKMEKLVASEV